MEELKPCPFCRGKARVIKESDPNLIQYKVMCQNCGISTPFIGSREQSEDTWNRRVAPKSDNTEVLEAYRGLLQKSQELSQTLLEKLKVMDEGENKPLTVEQFEAVCESVHNGWWEECKRQGRTNHPDMKPYDELPESVKDYDRVTVQRVLDTLGIKYMEMEDL